MSSFLLRNDAALSSMGLAGWLFSKAEGKPLIAKPFGSSPSCSDRNSVIEVAMALSVIGTSTSVILKVDPRAISSMIASDKVIWYGQLCCLEGSA